MNFSSQHVMMNFPFDANPTAITGKLCGLYRMYRCFINILYKCDRILENYMKFSVFLHVFNGISIYP